MIYILAATIVGLFALLAYKEYEHKKMIDKLTNALVARSAKELRDLEIVEKIEPVKEEPVKNDLTEIKDLTDKEFLTEIINREIN